MAHQSKIKQGVARTAGATLLAFAASLAVAGVNADRSNRSAGKPGFEQNTARQQNPGVFPVFSRPLGHSYSEWAASWWQWALQMPPSGHPLLDLPDSTCQKGQRGKVWFLGGNFIGEGTQIARSCEVPAGKALFFPLISNAYFAFLNDPPDTRTEEYIRSLIECTDPVISVSIDGQALRRPTQYLERSVLFDVQLPAANLFGLGPDVIPELKLSPSADFGYYLFLTPLKVGVHHIAWSAKMNCPSLGGDIFQNVNYSITVRPGRQH